MNFGEYFQTASLSIIFIHGDVLALGTISTMYSESGFVKKRDANRLPVREALIHKASNWLEQRV